MGCSKHASPLALLLVCLLYEMKFQGLEFEFLPQTVQEVLERERQKEGVVGFVPFLEFNSCFTEWE